MPAESRPDREQVTDFGGGKEEYKLSVMFSTIYFGCVTDGDYNEEKAYRFLGDMKEEFTRMYKGNLGIIFKQTNLAPNCYDKIFKQGFQKVYDNYNTGISNKNL